MEEIIRTARVEAQRKAHLDRLTNELQDKGRIDFGAISKRIVRDAVVREWAIRALVEGGIATVEVDFTTGGRPRTSLVLKE